MDSLLCVLMFSMDRDIIELIRLRLVERIETDEETDDVSTVLP